LGGYVSRCDYGKAFSIFQIQASANRISKRNLKDRKKATRKALKLLRSAFFVCSHLPVEYRISAYGSGRCRKGEQYAKRWKTMSHTDGIVRMKLAQAKAQNENP
jgi:hypothetical protein